ncbi:ABC transporter transmembrane domain-containing protein, partial [uncultured Ruminobacter sp.]
MEKPPKGFFRFVWFFTRDIKWYLLMISVLAAIIGAGEAFLFYFIGLFVDILNGYTGNSVFCDYRGVFILFGLMTLVLLPACITLHALLLNQTIRVNFPMRMRYRMHRYLLRQSLSYFADEFSGRVSQKLMQTSLSLRDTVLKFSNVIVHILVYFVTMMAVLAGTDLYLMLIMLVWLAGYLSLMYYFIPRLSRLSNDNA